MIGTLADPFGSVLIMVRDFPAVAAIVGKKVGSEFEDPPSVQLVAMPTSLSPFGRGSGRVGLQLFRAIAKCYGTNNREGKIQARQLAGAVVGALHNRGPEEGTAGLYFAATYTPEVGEAQRDPEGGWPFQTVRIEAYVGTQVPA